MTFTANVEFWGLILGLFTPLLTSVAQRPTWTSGQRTLVGFAISLLLGFLAVASAGELGDLSTLLTTLGLVLTAAETSYQKLWQPSGVAEVIEVKTTPGVAGEDLSA